MKLLKSIVSIAILVLTGNVFAQAQQITTVVVRAKAKDAKFIGDGMGGAFVTIENSATGKILARGLTKGDTGDTQRIVIDPVARYEKLSTPGAANFKAQISLRKPTLVTIKATANRGQADAEITSSTQKWLIPGKDITGDGVILELPGFVITNQLPAKEKSYHTGKPIPVRAHIVMMCGCSTKDGGLWDSSEYEIKAQISMGGHFLKEVPLSFTGTSSLFEGSFVPDTAGRYLITVYAFHPKTGNTGVAKTMITIEQ